MNRETFEKAKLGVAMVSCITAGKVVIDRLKDGNTRGIIDSIGILGIGWAVGCFVGDQMLQMLNGMEKGWNKTNKIEEAETEDVESEET